MVASAFGLRFQGQGFFLTDARTHRGTSGAPVVMRTLKQDSLHDEMPWTLLGVHSAVFDVGTRDVNLDEALNPAAYIGRAPEQVALFLNQIVKSVRNAYGTKYGTLSPSEPRV